MVEPSTLAKGALAAVRVGRAVGPLIAAYLGKDSNALAELMREGDAAWVTQFCEQLREKQEVLDQRFREVHPLITSLRWEAARDATDGRRRMLAYIAAHLLNSSESVESTRPRRYGALGHALLSAARSRILGMGAQYAPIEPKHVR